MDKPVSDKELSVLRRHEDSGFLMKELPWFNEYKRERASAPGMSEERTRGDAQGFQTRMQGPPAR